MKRCLACNSVFAGEEWTCPFCKHSPDVEGAFLRFAPELARHNCDYDPRHFDLLFALEDNSFWFQARNDLIVWALRRFFPKAEHIMEIGVGTGFVMRAIRQAFPNARLYGSDIHVAGLQFAAARLGNRLDLMQMDARRIPFREHFDVVCAFDVLEHIQDDEALLDEIRLSLRRDAGVVFTVPQHMFLWGPADEAAFHERRYKTTELAAKVRAAGFEVTFKTSFVSILLPLLWLSRRRSRKSGKYELARELAVPPALNRCLRGISALESVLIRAGIALPVGGSQLLVATRRR
jgi:SAM-dependent methyltransferase